MRGSYRRKLSSGAVDNSVDKSGSYPHFPQAKKSQNQPYSTCGGIGDNGSTGGSRPEMLEKSYPQVIHRFARLIHRSGQVIHRLSTALRREADLHKRDRVDPDSVDCDLPMHVRPGAAPGAATQPDHVALQDELSGHDVALREVRVLAEDAPAVIDNDVVAVNVE